MTENESVISTLIKHLEKRHIEGYYVATKEDAVQKTLSFIAPNTTISWGGSMTLQEIGLLQALEKQNKYHLLDRSKVAPNEVEDLYRRAFFADTYLMSCNALTVDGKLINIDGTGNRVAALIYGPKQVIVIVGINKLVGSETEGMDRLHNIACPKNAVRLNKKTPCTIKGKCQDCLSPDCICMQTVITRNSRDKGRIKVIIVGEELGY